MIENDRKVRDSLADLERFRLDLEQNIAKLAASLRHWQTWEIEYECMKEEILKLGEVHSSSDLENIGDAQNELLTPKERRLLLLDDRGNVRGRQQVVGILSRRIDYVQQNINTVSSLLRSAEEKYAATQVLSKPDVRNEEGLPLKEIYEELDEEGNIISASVSEPVQAAPQLLESLRKAGVKEIPSNAAGGGHSAPNQVGTEQASLDNKAKPESTEPGSSIIKSEGSNAMGQKASSCNKSRNTGKSVSFTADTKTESLLEHKSKTKIPTLKRVDPIIPVDGALAEEAPRQQPVIPANESPEDAALRRQIIQYNMREVNNIVAEMDLVDKASDASYSDSDSEETPDDNSLDEDEDKYGRTKRRVLTDEYLTEMRALEQRLNAKALQNVGPNAPLDASSMASSHGKEKQPPFPPASNGANKSPEHPVSTAVRFAQELDIQPNPPPPTTDSPSKPPAPPDPIHASKIIERPYSPYPNTTTPADSDDDDDDLDPALLERQVKTEYHTARNRMIQREGGFTATEDGPEVPLSEAEGGPKKKLSRFKAAILGRKRGKH